MKTAILMSTYNGEKYLDEQIESIVNQTYSDWNLYIRDDGSTDSTINIIKKWEKKDNRIIEFQSNENIGVISSFMTMISETDADYYFLSDQDDIWENDKVKDSLNYFNSKIPNNTPGLVHTNLMTVNSDNSIVLDPLFKNAKRCNLTFKSRLLANNVTGCTCLFNKSLQNEICKTKKNDYSKIVMHDWWIALVASGLGKVEFLNKAEIRYRQHGNNLVGASNKKSKLERVLSLFSKNEFDEFNKKMVPIYGQDIYFNNIYGKKLDKNKLNNIRNIIKFINSKNPMLIITGKVGCGIRIVNLQMFFYSIFK